MDFNVFYCNLVNILIHFFFPITGLLDESYLVGGWEGRGTGIYHLSPWQYSSVTVSTQWPAQLEKSPFETLCYCFSQKDQGTQVELWQDTELTSWWDSLWKQVADRLIRICLVSLNFSWIWCLNTPIFCLESWRMTEATPPVVHLFAVLLFRTVVAGKQMKTHSWSWNGYPYAAREGRASGNERQMLLLVTEIWQTPTQGGFSWLWQERSVWGSGCHQYCVTPSTVQWSQVRWGSANFLGKIQPVSLKRQYKTNNSTFILKG